LINSRDVSAPRGVSREVTDQAVGQSVATAPRHDNGNRFVRNSSRPIAYRQGPRTQPMSREIIYAGSGRADSVDPDLDRESLGTTNGSQDFGSSGRQRVDPAIDLARCFLRLAICPVTRSTALAGMKQSFGGRRSDPVCTRRVRSSQTTGQKKAFRISTRQALRPSER
jgi:hypothetical protein